MPSKLDLDLIHAAAEGDLASVRDLLAAGAHVNARHESGTTPLLAAALSGQVEAARVLLTAGADVEMRYRNEATALVLVAIQSDTEMARLLVAHGANVDEPIIEHGNEARMSYGDRFEVKFLKEDGAWKLKDLD